MVAKLHHSSGFFLGRGGLRIYYQGWVPENPRLAAILVHGAGEHSGRYQRLAEFLVDHQVATYALDHRGYGQSQGARSHVNRFSEYLDDLRAFVDWVEGQNPDWKRVMLGHSLGGLIALNYALDYPETLAGLIVSGPALKLRLKVPGWQKALLPLLSALAPRLAFPNSIAPEWVSRDPEVVQKYATDPLVVRVATPRWFQEFQRAMQSTSRRAADLAVPSLFLQGDADLLVDPEQTVAVYNQVKNPDKRLRVYPGYYHEVFNDPGKEQVCQDVLDWLVDHGWL